MYNDGFFLGDCIFVLLSPPRESKLSLQTLLQAIGKGWGYCIGGMRIFTRHRKCSKTAGQTGSYRFYAHQRPIVALFEAQLG